MADKSSRSERDDCTQGNARQLTSPAANELVTEDDIITYADVSLGEPRTPEGSGENKVLGLLWQTTEDMIVFHLAHLVIFTRSFTQGTAHLVIAR